MTVFLRRISNTGHRYRISNLSVEPYSCEKGYFGESSRVDKDLFYTDKEEAFQEDPDTCGRGLRSTFLRSAKFTFSSAANLHPKNRFKLNFQRFAKNGWKSTKI